MIRRHFLASTLSLLGFPPKKTPVFSEYGLGEYKSHKLEAFNICDSGYPSWYELSDSARMITFPIEGKITIQYEKGQEEYLGFNPDKELFHYINTTDIRTLLKNNISKELLEEKYYTCFIFGKKKFRISSVWFYNNNAPSIPSF